MDKRALNLFSGHTRWDDISILADATHFPEQLREGFIWLKSYTRDKCHRDVDLLSDRFCKAGVIHDRAVWANLLRGLYLKDAKGRQRPDPLMPADTFVEAVKALREFARAEEVRSRPLFVMTTTAQAIYDYIDLRRVKGRVNRWGVIVGPTGAQKSATFANYTLDRNHGSTGHDECPEGAAKGELLQMLAGDVSRQNNSYKLQNHLFESYHEGRCFIFDNAQHLFRPDKKGEQRCLSFLRRLQDKTKFCAILSITPEDELKLSKAAAYWEQFEGRSGGSDSWLRLPSFTPDVDVLQLAAGYGVAWAAEHLDRWSKKGPEEDPYCLMRLPKPFQADLQFLAQIARRKGRVRLLIEALQDGKIIAGSESLTVDHIRAAGWKAVAK